MNDDLEYKLYIHLENRYNEMAKGTKYENRINGMMEQVVDNFTTWPKDKTGRWVGYVQCILIEVLDVTTIIDERNFTRPLFHELYKSQGHSIPASVEIGQ